MNKKSDKKAKNTTFYVTLLIARLKRRVKKSKHRKYVLQQWYNTELSYRSDLQLALNNIKKPMLQKGIIDQEESYVLFPQFQGMLDLSKMMIETVKIITTQKNPNFIILGDQLLAFVAFYKVYGTYFGNRLRSERLLLQLNERNSSGMKQVDEQLKEKAKSINQKKANVTISDCLQQPQYRMFKYVLLMKDYLKKLPKTHRDYEPFKNALKKFQEINNSNNQLMANLEKQQKKTKLDRLFGKTIDHSSQYLVDMNAQSLYFPVKLYIFNNLVIVAAVKNNLGMPEEQRYLNMYLNEFSYIKSKPDAKYFKNVLMLCGQNNALHCFLPDLGSRQQIIVKMGRVFNDLQNKAISRRQLQNVGQNSGKISFVIDTNKKLVFSPQFRIQVLKVQVRPMGTFNNDTVYNTRFMAPTYIEDYRAIGHENIDFGGKGGLGIWQMVEVHMSQLTQLINFLKQQYPQIQFPQIDPLTRDINVLAQSKKQTKMYQARSYLIEQFFNFLFRHPTIILNSLFLARKYKIISTFWQYLCQKNDFISGRKETKDKNYPYGPNYSSLCKEVMKMTPAEAIKLRLEFQQRKRNDQSFNAFNLLRLQIINQSTENFKKIEEILLWEFYDSARIDYSMIPREELYRIYQEVNVYVCGQMRKTIILSDYRRKVGQIINDLALSIGAQSWLDYRLVIRYGENQRILDQDQVLFNLMLKFQFEVTEKEDNTRSTRQSTSQTTINQQQGFFSFLKNAFSSKQEAHLLFKKIIYLPTQYEIRSIKTCPVRAYLIVQQLFGRLFQDQIPLVRQEYGQLCALWLLIHKWGTLQGNSPKESLRMVYEQIIHANRRGVYRQQQFYQKYIQTYEQERSKLKSAKLSSAELINLIERSFRVFYRSVKSYTYIIPATARIVPECKITDGLGPISGDCIIGINFKQLVVFRNENSLLPSVRVPLADFKATVTPFSIFVDCGYFERSSMNVDLSQQAKNQDKLRFDARMLYHFQQLINTYQNLNKNGLIK